MGIRARGALATTTVFFLLNTTIFHGIYKTTTIFLDFE